ncbi:MAG TPA: helix-turn-helix domain-containing protein [Vitreimonas sp.]|uniref:helix-turn-helix domain-containing protein n=1 Tax=Vitreimonas sp. TaxID=3069702 RepID=UPI002D493DDF|nr:helix-turn-helix domain-containing protein [Vitreimonas sp.]HYD87137.1 helix-turn-helix domain-containing protein [Vitreimonas sp.]
MAKQSRAASASSGAPKNSACGGPRNSADAGASSFAATAHFREAHDLLSAPIATRVKAIVERCAARHGFTADQLKAKGRSRPLVKARNEAIQLVAKCFPDFSYPHLGKIFRRDHTTIMHALGVLGRQQKARAQ